MFNNQDVAFNVEKQINEVLQLVMILANITCIWENNWHTPEELYVRQERHYLKPLSARKFTWTDGTRETRYDLNLSKIDRKVFFAAFPNVFKMIIY